MSSTEAGKISMLGVNFEEPRVEEKILSKEYLERVRAIHKF